MTRNSGRTRSMTRLRPRRDAEEDGGASVRQKAGALTGDLGTPMWQNP